MKRLPLSLPPLPAAAWLLAGVIAGVVPLVFGWPWFGVTLTGVVPLLLLGVSRLSRPLLTAFAVGLAAGSVGALFRLVPAADSCARLLGRQGAYGTVELVVVDRTLPRGVAIADPGNLRARLETLQRPGEAAPRPVSGLVLLRLPPGAPVPGYGDRLRVTGSLDLGEPGVGLFDYRQLLRRSGAVATLWAERCELLGTESGVIFTVLAVRDRLLQLALTGLSDPVHQAMASQLFFGCRPGLDGETRQEQVRSGTIHLYCVSGLHVAVLAGLLLLLLRPLPLRFRGWLLLLLVLTYVITTGSGAPALRAFGLIAVLVGLRNFGYCEPPWRVLALAAAVLLVFNPWNLVDLGFLYSFLITAALFGAGRLFRRWRELRTEIDHWRPRRTVGRGERLARGAGFWLSGALWSCGAAFLGGVVLSLYFQGLLLPGSMVANLLILPVVGLLFPLLGFKLLAAALVPGLIPVANGLLNLVFGYLDTISGGCAAVFAALGAVRPAWWLVIAFYLALLSFPCRRGWRRGVAAAVVVLTLGWCLARAARPPAAVLLGSTGDARPPFCVIYDPAADLTLVVNVPDSRSAAAIERFLVEQGHPRIDLLTFSGGGAACLNGALALVRRVPTRSLALPSEPLKSATARRRFEELLAFAPLGCGTGLWKFDRGPEGASISYCNPGGGAELELELPDLPPGRARLCWNGARREYRFSRTNQMELSRHEFR